MGQRREVRITVRVAAIRDGVQRCMLTMPGTTIRGEQLSATEAVIVVCL